MNRSVQSLEWIGHFVFWTLILGLIYSVASFIFLPKDALTLGLIKVLILILIAYGNIFWTIPNWFRKGRFIYYFGFLILLCWVSIQLNQFLVSAFIQPYPRLIFPDNLPNFPFDMTHRMNGAQLFVTMVILLISTIYGVAKQFRIKEHQNHVLEQEKVAQELKFLRSQINPHFLFNALNNLKASVELYPKTAGQFIDNLGNILRYTLEESKYSQVSLEKEIEYIRNYIFFEEKKDHPFVSMKIEGDDLKRYFLEPLLFIPLVENAFSHSQTRFSADRFVSIEIDLEQDWLSFRIINSIPGDLEKTITQNHHGLGLKNVERRLNLLYPNKHQFRYGKKGDRFEAQLIIKPTRV